MKTTEVRVIAPEVGGGFGSKLNVYNDEILTAFAAKELGRPVKWTETRREAAGSTIHGRGWIGTATLVGTKDGEFLGYKLDAIADMGAYTQNFTVAIPLLGLWIGSGQYKMPISWTVACVVTNTMTTDAYRGAGRPEAIYYLERIIDAFAHEIGMDPFEVRRKNFWQPDEFPATMGCGFALDSGDYEAAVDKLIESQRLRRDAQETGRGPRRGPTGRGRGGLLCRGLRFRSGGTGRDRVLLGQLRAPGIVQRLRAGPGQPRCDSHRGHRHRPHRPGPRDDLGPDRRRRPRDPGR